MTLKEQANHLADCLMTICAALEQYDIDDRANYTKDLARQLRPLVAAFSSAVSIERSRERALGILADIETIMHEVNGAATKGEIDIFKDNALDLYWELHTIFRESQYSGENI